MDSDDIAVHGGPVHFEDRLWSAAEKLRGRVSPSQYRVYILTFLFLKYISDKNTGLGALDPESNLELPSPARWEALRQAREEEKLLAALDEALEAIEEANPHLRDTFQTNLFTKSGLTESRTAELFELFDDLELWSNESGDLFGRVHEYFLAKFAQTEGRGGGEFYTPHSVVSLLVNILAPYGGRVYDPCCGAGGMFVHSERFIMAHRDDPQELKIYGQEANPATWGLARMNLAARGLEYDLGGSPADTFLNDQHCSERADYILANPPFNMSDWGHSSLEGDSRFQYGLPPKSNANFAWLQHIIHHLNDTGFAGVVLANGSLSASVGSEGEIRRNIVEDNLVDCIVALPGQLFYSTSIAVCLWILSKNKSEDRYRKRDGEVLFVDASSMGHMVSRTHRVLDQVEIEMIASTYHQWRGDEQADRFTRRPGFATAASVDEIRNHRYALVPGRYVGFSPEEKVDEAEDAAAVRDELQELKIELGAAADHTRAALKLLEELANG